MIFATTVYMRERCAAAPLACARIGGGPYDAAQCRVAVVKNRRNFRARKEPGVPHSKLGPPSCTIYSPSLAGDWECVERSPAFHAAPRCMGNGGIEEAGGLAFRGCCAASSALLDRAKSGEGEQRSRFNWTQRSQQAHTQSRAQARGQEGAHKEPTNLDGASPPG